MIGTTVPTAALADELLKLWEDRRVTWPGDDRKFQEALDVYFDLIDYHSRSDEEIAAGEDTAVGDGVWMDLRPSEVAGLRYLVGEAKNRAFRRCVDVLREEFLVTALRFDEDFPDTPRQADPARGLA